MGSLTTKVRRARSHLGHSKVRSS